MKQFIFILILLTGISCQNEKSIFRDSISIELSTYEDGNKTKAFGMPELRAGSELMTYKRRFEYLLMNIPEILHPSKMKERDSINALYPDTSKIKQLYLDRYCGDQKLVSYFEETYTAIKNRDLKKDKTYSADELMKVASIFFYCDQVNPDTSIGMHVCIGINGMKETKWEKDYTLLAAFCFEAIFTDLDNDNSQIRDAYVSEKKESSEQLRKNFATPEQYLEDVKSDVFNRMENNVTLKEKLLAYYELNKNNVVFTITE
jgi:hypothetical protein